MAEVDTSMYGNLLKPPNAAEQMNAFTNMSSSMTHNALMTTQNAVMGQQYRANKAMGQVMQQSIGPDGQVDYDKAVTSMAQNPDTAFLAPEYMSKLYANKGLALDNKIKQFDIVAKQQGLFGNAAGALLSKGDGVKRSDVASSIGSLWADMAAAGISDEQTKDRLLTFMGALKQDGPELHQQLQGVAQQASGAADSLNKVVGSFTVQDLGGQKVIGYTNPINRSFQPIGRLDNTPTPEAMNAPTTTVGPDGSQQMQPRVQVAPMYTGSGAQMNGQPQQPMAPGGQPSGTQPLMNAPPQAAVTKLSPEIATWLQGRGENSVKYAKDLQGEVSGVQTQLQMLQQMQDLSSQFKGGAGSSVKMKLAGMAQAMGMPKDTVDQIGLGNYAAAQAFEKYSVQNTMNILRQAIGGQGRLTNLEFEQFLHSNPNLDTDPKAVGKILAMSQKLYQLKIAEQRGLNDWVKSGHAPADFPTAWTQKLVERGVLRTAKADDLSQENNFPFKPKKA